MEQFLRDVLILGGGPGGYTAALYCARAGLSTLVLERLTAGGQMATTSLVDNYPGFEEGIDGFALGEKMRQSAERFGAQTLFTEVTSVELADVTKRVHTTSGVFEGRTAVVATGALPRELGLPHEQELLGRGVAYCATCDGMFYRNKTVAVVGGGNSAAEDAQFLSRICKKVYLVHRRDTLRASHSYQLALQGTGNIEFIWDTRVTALQYEEKLTGLSLENLKTGASSVLKCDGIFVAIGRTPNTALFAGQLEMDQSGYLIADESTRTSLPGVFAVGDLRTKPLRQIVTAASDGAVASKYVEEFLTELRTENG